MAKGMTYGETVAKMIEIGSNREQAQEFFDSIVHTYHYDHGLSTEEAKSLASGNLGYLMGYAVTEIDVKMWQEIGCLHPVFGDMTKDSPSAEEAFQAGVKVARG